MPSAIVIGAGPGIGVAVARRLAREGLAVGVIARSQATVASALSALDGADAHGATADVADEQGLRAALDELVERVGVPQVLVYNVGLIQADAIGDLTAQQHLDAYAVNVVGAITATAHLGPRMADEGGATIVLTGGMPEVAAEYASLSLGKAAVRALVALLEKTYGPAGVHAATVTVYGEVASGTRFDPDEIAEEYWRLHTQPADAWECEVAFTGG
jgi:NAD(P)-dependent dehydrogenase (short-subunit alcohol dehydrogenase family)